MELGDKIRQLRLYHNISQSMLAEGICSVAYLSKVENGKTKPTEHLVEKLSERLEVTIDVLKDDLSEKYKRQMERLIDKYDKDPYHIFLESEIRILRLYFLELLPLERTLRVFNILLHYFVRTQDITKSDEIFTRGNNLIPMEQKNFTQNVNDVFFLFKTVGNYFYIKEDFELADYYFIKAKDYGNENQIEMAKIYYNISITKQRIVSDMNVCLLYAKHALDIFDSEEKHLQAINVLISKSIQYNIQKNFDKAFACLNEAQDRLTLFPNLENKSTKIMIFYHLGKIHQEKEEFDMALKQYNQALDNTNKQSNEAVYIFNSLLDIYIQKKEWDRIDYYLTEAINLATQKKLQYQLVELLQKKANVFKLRGDEDGYEREMKNALTKAIEQKLSKLVKEISNELADYYYELRYYKKSSNYYRIASNKTT
ncbi:helix-turn-helix domain-containing protein [Shouchella patagoniensis]|uniref:helix-turn-helix domain-containing protein n=1 Tax=Shouchella patagoniensis TaxID=228576 RepID=UPI0009952E3E|nr:helix-turn-helix domain-containing protein [Shouchella patagoniensis]